MRTRMRRRRELPEITNNHERWLVSYADFLTLLFAFFVAMYSTSALNSGQFRALSNSILNALDRPQAALSPVVDAQPPSDESQGDRIPLETASSEAEFGGTQQLDAARDQLRLIEQELGAAMGERLDLDQLSLSSEGDWVDLKIPAELLFPSGSRALLASSKPMLASLAQRLREFPNEIVVQGHTDDRPIRNGLFPSNWELSSARAASVTRVLQEQGIAAERLSAQGFAATRPVVANTSDDSRAENRRVVLRVRSLARNRDSNVP
ncbi:MAG: OmpA family protein [Pseudomonadota bacterium]